jgi:hypothetical protein
VRSLVFSASRLTSPRSRRAAARRRTRLGVVILTVALNGCVTSTVACGPGTHELSFDCPRAGSWRLERVEPDGSVVVSRAGKEQTLPPTPSRGGGWGPDVLLSSPIEQVAILRLPHCSRSKSFLWWTWSTDPDYEDD